jgi:hypothetical protein
LWLPTLIPEDLTDVYVYNNNDLHFRGTFDTKYDNYYNKDNDADYNNDINSFNDNYSTDQNSNDYECDPTK